MNCQMVFVLFGWMISFLGILGNVIAFCTLGKMDQRNASTTLLRSLAVVDLTFLVTELLIPVGYLVASRALIIVLALAYQTALTVTIWTPLLVGIHRYIVVCKPLMAATVCTVSNARKHIVVVLVISVIVNLPLYYECEMWIGTLNATAFNGSMSNYRGEKRVNTSNVTAFDDSVTFYQRKLSLWYETGYKKVFLMGLINYAIPVLSLLFITARLLQTLRSARQSRKVMAGGQSHGQGHDNRTVDVMVIVVLVVFMICNIFQPLAIYLAESTTSLGNERIVISCMHFAFAFLPPKINSSANCLIYITFNRTFRQTLGPCCKSR